MKYPTSLMLAIVYQPENERIINHIATVRGRFQLGIHGEVFYSSKKMQTGLRIGLPIGNIAKHEGQRTSLRTEVIFRLPLFFSDNK